MILRWQAENVLDHVHRHPAGDVPELVIAANANRFHIVRRTVHQVFHRRLGEWLQLHSVTAINLSWTDGGETVSERLRDVHIWTRAEDGSWKLMVDVWNSLDPAE